MELYRDIHGIFCCWSGKWELWSVANGKWELWSVVESGVDFLLIFPCVLYPLQRHTTGHPPEGDNAAAFKGGGVHRITPKNKKCFLSIFSVFFALLYLNYLDEQTIRKKEEKGDSIAKRQIRHKRRKRQKSRKGNTVVPRLLLVYYILWIIRIIRSF